MPSPRRVLAVIDRNLPAAARAVRRARFRLLMLTRRFRRNRAAFVPAAVEVLKAAEPEIAETIARGQVGAWIEAAHTTALALPDQPPVRPVAWAPGLPPGKPPPLPPIYLPGGYGDPPDRLVLPVKAAEYLRTRLDFTPDEFLALDAEAKAVGFTVARAASLDAVGRIREALARDVEDGGTLGQFRGAVEEALGPSALADHQVESLYRTQVGRAYSAGQQAILAHPLVADAFPYLLYSATHDSRVRPEHLAMETLGLNGTAVYRADDPIWQWFYPPWGWGCRCVVIPLSVEDAADYGVKEAIEWARSGRPPVYPQYVPPPPFGLPRGWVPTGSRLSVY